MSDDVNPPLRNYQQMVRVVKGTNSSYQLANAYGDNETVEPTDKRMRTLDEMGLPSESIRRPAATISGGEFDTRTQTAHFHELNHNSQHYFSGVSPPIISRNDNMPGTKERTSLGAHSFVKKIEPTINLSPMQAHAKIPNSKESKKKNKSTSSKSTPSPDKG
jgi:hypothetical protein